MREVEDEVAEQKSEEAIEESPPEETPLETSLETPEETPRVQEKKTNRTAPPRKKKPVPEVNEPIPAMTKREKLKEKVTCEGCNKTITRHAQRYTHKCPAPEAAVEDIEEAPPPPPQLSRAPLRRPPQEHSLERGSTTPGKDFMERLRVASLAYQQLERQKHSNLIRNFYGY